MASASSPSTDKPQKETTSDSNSPSGAISVTAPFNVSQSVARVYPIVTNTFGNSRLQPTALVIPSGTAYDYENYPKLVSVCWPVIIDQSGNSVVPNVAPSRVLSQGTGNDASKTVTFVNSEKLEDMLAFRWDRPAPETKEPVIRAPGMKTPICASYDSCGVQNEGNTRNIIGSSGSSSLPHQLPTLVQPCGCPIHAPCMVKRPRLQQITSNGQVSLTCNTRNGFSNGDAMMSRVLEHKRYPGTHLNHEALGLPNADTPSCGNQNEVEYMASQEKNRKGIQNPDSYQPTVRQILGNETSKIKPFKALICLPGDNKQGSQLQGTVVSQPVNKESETRQLTNSSSGLSFQASEPCLEDGNIYGASNSGTRAPSKNYVSLSSKNVLSSSVEVEMGQQSNTVSNPKASQFPIVIEDDSAETATQNKSESSEGSHVFLSAPSHGADESPDYSFTVTAQPTKGSDHQPNLETGSKEEIVRDLIARIRYIKSKLNRAECEQRKKKMLRTILGLQKRVKALAKRMRKERKDPANDLEVTSDKPLKTFEVTSGHDQELPEVNNQADSVAMDTNNCELRAGNVIQDELVLARTEGQKGNRDTRKPTTDISKEVTTTNCKDQKHREELTITCPDSAIPQNDARNKETGTEELKSSPLSGSNSGDTNMTNGNKSGNLRVISPGEIELDSPPGTCIKRSVSPSDVSESEFQRYHFTTFKKMKRLSLSEENVVDKINSGYSSIFDVTHYKIDGKRDTNETVIITQNASRDAQGVTQLRSTEGLGLNEKDYVEDRVANGANVSRKEIYNLVAKYEVKNNASVASNFQDVTQDKQGVTQEAGVSEASLPTEVNKEGNCMEPNEENMTAKEICNFSVNGNEIEHGVMYDASKNDTQDTTLETGLTQNEDNQKQSLSLDDTQNGKDTRIMATEEKELAETSLERGLMEEVGEGAHSQTYIGKEHSDRQDGIYDYASRNCNENHFVSEDVNEGENVQSPPQAHCTQDSLTQESQDIDWYNGHTVQWEDNENDQELFRLSLEANEQEESSEIFPSPVIPGPNTKEEDVDFMQSLQIRQARILNLTEKRNRLFNLVMNQS